MTNELTLEQKIERLQKRAWQRGFAVGVSIMGLLINIIIILINTL
jgi:hypothetical protein